MIPVFITARMASTRLKHKHMLPLGSYCVIDFVVRRCEHFGFKPYLCVPQADMKAFHNVTSAELYGGDLEVETRLIEASQEYNIPHFHHLDGDDPFFDEYAVIDSFNAAVGPVGHVLPSYQSMSGSGRVGTSYNINPQAKQMRHLADRLENYPWPQRLTLDYQEDYWLIASVERMAGGYMAPRRAVDELFVKNPDLHRINWHLTAEWKDRQNAERSR